MLPQRRLRSAVGVECLLGVALSLKRLTQQAESNTSIDGAGSWIANERLQSGNRRGKILFVNVRLGDAEMGCDQGWIGAQRQFRKLPGLTVVTALRSHEGQSRQRSGVRGLNVEHAFIFPTRELRFL